MRPRYAFDGARRYVSVGKAGYSIGGQRVSDNGGVCLRVVVVDSGVKVMSHRAGN